MKSRNALLYNKCVCYGCPLIFECGFLCWCKGQGFIAHHDFRREESGLPHAIQTCPEQVCLTEGWLCGDLNPACPQLTKPWALVLGHVHWTYDLPSNGISRRFTNNNHRHKWKKPIQLFVSLTCIIQLDHERWIYSL